MRSLAAILILIAHLTVTACPAQAAEGVRLDTPSGYPVPRFVSLKDDETNCRIGPSFDHPVRYIFKRAGAPVLVVAESVDHWRRIRDPDGDECWVHQTTLRAQTHVLIVGDLQLKRRPAKTAQASAQIGAGVLARIVKRKGDWLLLSAENARGWTEASSVWGGAAPVVSPAGRD